MPASGAGRVVLAADVGRSTRWWRRGGGKAPVSLVGDREAVVALNKSWLDRSVLQELLREIRELVRASHVGGAGRRYALCAAERYTPHAILVLSALSLGVGVVCMLMQVDCLVPMIGACLLLLTSGTTYYCCRNERERKEAANVQAMCEAFATAWTAEHRVSLVFVRRRRGRSTPAYFELCPLPETEADKNKAPPDDAFVDADDGWDRVETPTAQEV